MVNIKTLEVVMPVYNGAKYLEEQILSIYQQTLPPVRLLVKDDNSTDSSFELLCNLKKQYYGKWLEIAPQSSENVGCIRNVACLLSLSKAEYIALSDQDDIWYPEKLETLLKRMLELEAKSTPQLPILVHSELELIDHNMQFTGKVYTKNESINPYRQSLDDLLITNVVTGCSTLLNRALVTIALPFPEEALMHDWWLALIASRYGKIQFIEKPLLGYRQHSMNLLGSDGKGFKYILKSMKRLHFFFSEYIDQIYAQNTAFSIYHLRSSKTVLLKILTLNRISRLKLLLYDIGLYLHLKHTTVGSLMFLVLIMFKERQSDAISLQAFNDRD